MYYINGNIKQFIRLIIIVILFNNNLFINKVYLIFNLEIQCIYK